MEFRNLAEVTKLEEVPEGASVLAATAEGEVVRVPGGGNAGGWQFVINVEVFGEGDYFEEGTSWYAVYSTTDNNVSCDKSLDEIKNAYESGLVPVVVVKINIEEYSETHFEILNLNYVAHDYSQEITNFDFEGSVLGDGSSRYTNVHFGLDMTEVVMIGKELS